MNRVAPTRMNLLRTRRQLEQVARGTALLRRKREALVNELFQLARGAVATRARIAEQAADAYPALLGALARHGHAGLTVLGWPSRDLQVEIRAGRVWDVPVAEVSERSSVTEARKEWEEMRAEERTYLQPADVPSAR